MKTLRTKQEHEPFWTAWYEDENGDKISMIAIGKSEREAKEVLEDGEE